MSFSDSSTPPPPPETAPVAVVALRSAAVRRDSVTVALGVAFLASAVVVSASRARSGGGDKLDATVFLVGVVATIVLLGFGAAARALVDERVTAAALMSWPFAFGTVGTGLMIGVGLDDGDTTAYLAGAVVIAMSVAGYLLVPSAPPAVAGILGTLLVYGQAVSDVIDPDLTGDDTGFKTFAVTVLVFVVAVTAIAWLLPPARTTVSVVVGAGAVLAYLGIMAAIGFTAALSGFDLGSDGEFADYTPPSYDSDVYTTFLLAAVLVVGWMVLGYLSDSPGFRVLVVAMVATVFPTGIALLAVEHPTGWALGAGVIGAVVLALSGLRATRSTHTG